MCAIFGIIGNKNLSLLKKMSLCQIYRGPDSQSLLVDKKNNFSIGMNRLSVIDKKKGKQPMLSYDKRHVIVFNGTIYNFNEIKKILSKKKIPFKTNSDTEVLVNAYNYWGKKCFNYFDGMWAVGIFDYKKKKFILSRDYIGQKPLFYHKDKEKLIFSSQINGIFKYSNNFKISERNYEDYLRFNYFHAPNTLYKNIFQVCPGETIEFEKNSLKKKKYWKVEKKSDYNLFFRKKYKNEIRNNFTDTIKNFLIADKNVGLTLSSGNDSTLLKNIMLKHKKKINSFTIGFKDKSYDESLHLKKEKNNHNLKKILYEKDLLKTFNTVKKNIFFPFGDSSLIPTLNLFNLVKNKTNVVLGGDGGDEIFFGYLSFKAYYISCIIKKIIPNFVLKLIKYPFSFINISTEYLGFKKKIKFFFKFIDKDLSLINTYWISNFDDNEANQYFKRKKSLSTYNLKQVKNIFKNHSNKMRFAQIYYLKYFLPMIMTKVDFASMFNSVESRSPYLSKNLLNFSLDFKTKKNFSLFGDRLLMKEIFSEYFDSKNKLNKHGFAFNKYLILKNKQFIMNNIEDKFLLNSDYFYNKLHEYIAGNYDNEQYLWNEIILNFSRQNLE